MKSNADCCLFKCAHTLSPTPVPYASMCVCLCVCMCIGYLSVTPCWEGRLFLQCFPELFSLHCA